MSARVSPGASPVEQFAASEFKRLARSVFGPRLMGKLKSSEKPGPPIEVLIGAPDADPQIASMLAAHAQPPLQEQEYLILPCEGGIGPAALLAGGSPAAALWAVYDLAETWGVTFLTDREVMPAARPAQMWPAQPIRRSPWLGVRAWRGLNQLPHSGAYWGLEDYVRLIDQLAKMRFNCFFIADGPNTPLVDFTWANAPKRTAALSFGWRYPVNHDTIGREKFKGEAWFENPDVPYEGTYQEKVAATKQLVQGIMDHARSRGMRAGVSIRFTEFADEFKERLCQMSANQVSANMGLTAATAAKTDYVYRLGVAREGADPSALLHMTVRNPHYVDLIQAQLEAYLEQCAGCDYFVLWPPEFNNANSDADFAWRALCEHYPLGDVDQFEAMIRKAVQEQDKRANALSAGRLQQQLYNHVCSLYLLDELLNRRGLKAKHGIRDDQFVVCLPSPVLGSISSRVLGANTNFMVALGNGYHASNAAGHVQELADVDGLPQPLHLTLSLEDDNIGLTPQFTAPSLAVLLQGAQRHRISGVWCRQWLLNKIEPTIHYLSHVCWDSDLTPAQAYQTLAHRLCGDAATPVMLQAFALGEKITVDNDEALNLHSFLVPKMLAKHWEDGVEVKPQMLAMGQKYQQLRALLEQARVLSQPRGRFFLDRLIGQCRFAEHWITVMQKLRQAAEANEDALRARRERDIARMDDRLQASVALLDEALATAELAIGAWADAVGDRADLGALAALNEYGYRYLLAVRHIQFIRSEHWDCQLSAPSQPHTDGTKPVDRA